MSILGALPGRREGGGGPWGQSRVGRVLWQRGGFQRVAVVAVPVARSFGSARSLRRRTGVGFVPRSPQEPYPLQHPGTALLGDRRPQPLRGPPEQEPCSAKAEVFDLYPFLRSMPQNIRTVGREGSVRSHRILPLLKNKNEICTSYDVYLTWL